MNAIVHVGPKDDKRLPEQSLGIIFYNELKKKDPNRVVLVDVSSNEEINYGQFLKSSIKLAESLKKLGVKKGDIVTIISQNNWRYLVTTVAAFYIGATVNPLNHDYTPGELKHFLKICRPTLIFCTKKTLQNVLKLKEEPTFSAQNIIIYDSKSTAEATNFDDILEKDHNIDSFTPTELQPEDVAVILTSSGTTGLPKCVMLTHANYRITMSYAGDPLLMGITPKENLVNFLPLFHIFGNAIGLASILFGAKCVLMDKFSPEVFLRVVQDRKITKLLAVPPILMFLLKSPLVGKYDISSIQDIQCGAALLSKELEEMAQDHLKISVRQIYGMTEVSGAATILPLGVKKQGTVGKVNVTYRIKVCDVDSGDILPPNRVGELRIAGPGLMKGYLGNVAESEGSVDEEGFMKSGDLGYYDEEGFFYIVDRLKEIIKCKGFQVSPAELEDLLIQHPAVKDAGVIGIPDERAGEVPLAFVVKQPNRDVSEEELVRYIEDNVSIQKRLYGGVKFIEDIPKSPSGKILRRELKDVFLKISKVE